MAAKKRTPAFRKLVADYEACGGNVIRTLFPKDDELHAAFLAWGKKAWPHWFSEVSADYRPPLRAFTLERLIADEEDEAAVCAFFEELPKTTRAKVAAAIAKQAKAMWPDPPKKGAKPAPVKKKVQKQILVGKTAYDTAATELALESSGLTELPDEIGEMSALKVLDVSENPITALPATLSRCAELRRLLVGDTRLAALPRLPQIEVLSAYKTSASFLASLAAAPSLQQLSICECSLDELPESLRELKKLRYLDFRDNPIKKLPSWLAELPITNFAWNEDLPQAEVARLREMETQNKRRKT